MFCHNCGKQNLPESRHCVYCGAYRFGNISESTKVPIPNSEQFEDNRQGEERLFRVRPTFLTVAIMYSLAALLTVATTVLIAYLGGSILWVWASMLTLFSLPLLQHLRRNKISYTLKSDKIEIEQGLFSRTSQNLALRHINNVAVYQSLPERLVGIGDVLIDSAGTADRIALKSIRNPREHANLILMQLQRWK